MAATWVVRGDPATRAFAVLGFREGALAAVDDQSRRRSHGRRRIIGGTLALSPDQAGDLAFDLKKLATSAPR